MSLIDDIRRAQVRAGEDVVVSHLERTLAGLKTDEKAAGDTDETATIRDELLKAIRRVYDDVGPPGEFGYNTRIGKALANLYDVFNKALRTAPVPPKPVRVAEQDFELRGKLASSLSFWHRLTGNEAAELVTLLAAVPQPAPSAKPATEGGAS